LQRPSQQPDAAAEAPPANGKDDKTLEPLDIISEDWAGNVNAFEVSAEGGGSAIEETAILFANGLLEPAEAGLRAAIQSDQLGEAAQHGWLMLFELLQQRGDRAGFDSLTIEYVLRFESSPPAWIDYRDEHDLGGGGRRRGASNSGGICAGHRVARGRRRRRRQASRAVEKSFPIAPVDHARLLQCAQR
jgi:hypothetical protein